MNREKSERVASAIRAVCDERLTDPGILELALWLTPLQRPGTALCVYVTGDPGVDVLTECACPAEELGLVAVTREPDPSRKGVVRLAFCATEAGRLWVERFRPHWDDFGFWSTVTSDDGPVFGPMPWPGLPEPYQPGSIPVTVVPRLGEATL